MCKWLTIMKSYFNHHFIVGLQTCTAGGGMHSLFSLLAGCLSDFSEDSTYSLKERCKSTTRNQ